MWSRGTTLPPAPRGLAFNADGRLLVADYGNSWISTVDVSNGSYTHIGTNLGFLTGIAVGPDLVIENTPPDCSTAATPVAEIWPANSALVDVDVAVSDPDGDKVVTLVTGIRQDEPVRGPGSGNTSPDGSGVGTGTAQVRAERNGNGNGRVYHIRFVAADGRGGTCSGEVIVGVPHDRSGSAVGDGSLFDSTLP
jgi:hypothetical protein